jgi:hypothetical protein
MSQIHTCDDLDFQALSLDPFWDTFFMRILKELELTNTLTSEITLVPFSIANSHRFTLCPRNDCHSCLCFSNRSSFLLNSATMALRSLLWPFILSESALQAAILAENTNSTNHPVDPVPSTPSRTRKRWIVLAVWQIHKDWESPTTVGSLSTLRKSTTVYHDHRSSWRASTR